MPATERGEIARMRLAGWSVFVVGVDVVEVAAAGVAGAPGEDAVRVAQDDELAHPGGWVVLVDGVGAGEVQDGSDADPGVGDPLLDPGGGGRAEPLDLAEGLDGCVC
jgi:hypothetical protein